jgi:hypothetical protein
LASSTAKRVILYRFDRQPSEAVVHPGSYLLPDHVELITIDGKLQTIGYESLKALCFASEAGEADLFSVSNVFERRPKVPGLWTRFLFRDGDRLDGILSPSLLEWPKEGYVITPPKSGAARQRVFIPRAAILGTELRGVVGSSAASRANQRKEEVPKPQDQLRMFER